VTRWEEDGNQYDEQVLSAS